MLRRVNGGLCKETACGCITRVHAQCTERFYCVYPITIMNLLTFIWFNVCTCLNIFFFRVTLQPNADHGLLIHEFSRSQSVELLWTSDRVFAETSTWQHTTLTTNIHPPRRYSNPRSQQASGHRPTPYTARLLGPARLNIHVSDPGTYHYNQFQSGPTVKQAIPAVFLKHYTWQAKILLSFLQKLTNMTIPNYSYGSYM